MDIAHYRSLLSEVARLLDCELEEIIEDAHSLRLQLADGRTQRVHVERLPEGRLRLHTTCSGWCSEVEHPNLMKQLLVRNWTLPHAGFALSDDGSLVLVCNLLVDTLNPTSLSRILREVAQAGDQMEKEFAGGAAAESDVF